MFNSCSGFKEPVQDVELSVETKRPALVWPRTLQDLLTCALGVLVVPDRTAHVQICLLGLTAAAEGERRSVLISGVGRHGVYMLVISSTLS